MPDGNIKFKTGKEGRGFPFDGYWCDETMTLKKKGPVFVVEDANDGVSDDFQVTISERSLVVKGTINCGLRAVIGTDKFTRR